MAWSCRERKPTPTQWVRLSAIGGAPPPPGLLTPPESKYSRASSSVHALIVATSIGTSSAKYSAWSSCRNSSVSGMAAVDSEGRGERTSLVEEEWWAQRSDTDESFGLVGDAISLARSAVT